MVAPLGTLSKAERCIPKKVNTTPRITLNTNVRFKVFTNNFAILAGIVVNAATSNTPTILIANPILIANKITKNKFQNSLFLITLWLK